MTAYKCPYCGTGIGPNDETLAIRRINFEYGHIDINQKIPCLEIMIFRCPNSNCGKESIFAAGVNGYIGNSQMPIYPPAVFRRFPDYIPSAILQDYEEACFIAIRSPKAAAALARRCLQGMIHDFWNIHAKNLNTEITQLKDKIPASQWKAIDAVRKIGNIGAHMEHDVNLIIEIDTAAAQKLIKLIELLIDKWYVSRHDEEELYSDLVSISLEAEAARLNPDTNH